MLSDSWKLVGFMCKAKALPLEEAAEAHEEVMSGAI